MMKLFVLILLSLFATACQKSPSESQRVEVKSLIERADTCIHFSGEFNGDHSERDREVAAEMDKLKCAGIDQELLDAKKQYKNDPQILEQINQAAAQF